MNKIRAFVKAHTNERARVYILYLIALPRKMFLLPITAPANISKNFQVTLKFLAAKLRGRAKFSYKDFRDGFVNVRILPSAPAYVDDVKIQRIISAYQLSKKDQVDQPKAYQIGGEWAGLINLIYGDLIAHIENQRLDKVRSTLENFAKDKISMGLSAYGTIANGFFTSLEYLNYYNEKIEVWRSLTGLPDEYLEYPKIGNLHGVKQGDNVVSWTSFQMTYFAQQIVNLVPNKDSRRCVVEVGGGYGGLAYFLFKAFDFSGGRYMNLDIPENNMIVAFFLMSAFPEKRICLYGEGDGSDSEISIMPNYCLKNLPAGYADIVFNSHSLTEMSPETVKEYLKQIDRVSDQYFFHANHEGNPDDYGVEVRHVNLNNSEFELSSTNWKRIYRLPEVITNVQQRNKLTLFTFWEYLYEKI